MDSYDLKQLLITINTQKKDLKKATEEIKDIALFTMQNPDPLLRISINGEIIMQNPPAEMLESFEYHGEHYQKVDFWHFITKKGNYVSDRWSFEVTSSDKIYSFVCRYLPDYNYFNVYGREITKQKKNEAQLFRLSLLASVNQNGVLFMDGSGKITWANEGFCKLSGYAHDEVLGKTTLEFYKGPLTKQATIASIASRIGNLTSFNDEVIHYRKDGSWFWGRVMWQSFQLADNDNLQYFSMIEDISKEKAQEEQLKVLSQIAENNIDAVVITDKYGCITWVNKSFTQMTGYSLKEALHKKPGNLLQGKDTDKNAIAYLNKQITAGEPFATEIINYSKQGKPYWLRLKGQPITDDSGALTGFFALQEDISSEKEIQQRLEKSKNQVRDALEKIGDNVWEHNFSTAKTFFSKSNNAIFGFPADETSDFAALWWSSIHLDDLKILEENNEKYEKGEIDSHALEYRITHSNGSFKWVLDRGVVIEKDIEGKPLRIIGTHTDISTVKQTETELEQRVQQFKSLSENVPGIIYEYEFKKDGTEGIKYISPALERIFGVTADDFKNYLNYIHPDDREQIITKNIHSKTTLEPFHDESRLILPGKSIKWHEVHSSYSYTDQHGSKIFTGYMMDITERKNIEQTLRANEEKYRSIIENMNLGLLEVDNSQLIVYANESFCNMSGYSSSYLVGKNGNAIFFNGDTDSILHDKLLKPKQGRTHAYELEVVNKSGINKWWFISSAPRYNEAGEMTGTVGIFLDITDRKRLELELTKARNQAENLARTKEIFLANMSHEIRTPMNAIIGMSRQLGKSYLLPQQQFYLDVINTASDNLLVIINDILDFSKIEAGKLTLENIGFQPLAVAKKAIQILSHKAEEKGLKLSIAAFDNDIANVLIGDPYRLNQILINLIGNSIKFTDSGAIDLAFKLISNNEATQIIQVDVKDTGIGMDASFTQRLFDKFSQEDESISRKYGGTGLGMSICRDLVGLMNGKIFAESTKGAGTTISFTLALRKGTLADLPDKRLTEFKADFLSGRTIMVTDDNELNRLVASIILQNFGANVIESVNGVHAIELLKSHHPDIILMDVQMPLLNGIQCTRLIRESGNAVPIIALTAQAIKGEREKCIEAGMNDFISKPFEEADFLGVIDKWLTKQANPSNSEGSFNKVSEQLYNLSGLIEISRGNDLFVEKMVRMFCDQTPPLMIAMIEAFNSKQFEQMAAIAHKIKPSIDNLNIIQLKQAIRDIESIGNEKEDKPILADLLKKTNETLQLVVAQMYEQYPA